jgi:hypothetical protein
VPHAARRHAIRYSERIIVHTSLTARLTPLVGMLALAAAPALALPRVSSPVPADSSHAQAVLSTTPSAFMWSGVYRVHLALGGRDAAPAALVVEREPAGLSGFMLVDERGAPLSAVRVEGDVLRARITTAQGTGELTLRITGDVVTGTLKVGKQRWDVSGQRTA